MDHRNIVAILLGLIISFSCGMVVVLAVKNSQQTGSSTSANWKWDDKWGGQDTKTSKLEEPVKSDKPETEVKPQVQIIASSFDEAMAKSGELGKPVLLFFSANWCGPCKTMKATALTDPAVVELMKNYVLLHVDVDKNRILARKFGVQQLPSYAVSNYTAERLKFGSGALDAAGFAKFLDDQTMFNQPKGTPKKGIVEDKILDGDKRPLR